MSASTPRIESGADFLRYVRETGGHATDGVRPPEWSAGWAIIPFATTRDDRAHWWWRRRATFARPGLVWLADWESLCGRVQGARTYKARDGRQVDALSPGNFPRCAFCACAVQARMRHSIGLPIGKAFLEHDPR